MNNTLASVANFASKHMGKGKDKKTKTITGPTIPTSPRRDDLNFETISKICSSRYNCQINEGEIKEILGNHAYKNENDAVVLIISKLASKNRIDANKGIPIPNYTQKEQIYNFGVFRTGIINSRFVLQIDLNKGALIVINKGSISKSILLEDVFKVEEVDELVLVVFFNNEQLKFECYDCDDKDLIMKLLCSQEVQNNERVILNGILKVKLPRSKDWSHHQVRIEGNQLVFQDTHTNQLHSVLLKSSTVENNISNTEFTIKEKKKSFSFTKPDGSSLENWIEKINKIKSNSLHLEERPMDDINPFSTINSIADYVACFNNELCLLKQNANIPAMSSVNRLQEIIHSFDSFLMAKDIQTRSSSISKTHEEKASLNEECYNIPEEDISNISEIVEDASPNNDSTEDVYNMAETSDYEENESVCNQNCVNTTGQLDSGTVDDSIYEDPDAEIHTVIHTNKEAKIMNSGNDNALPQKNCVSENSGTDKIKDLNIDNSEEVPEEVTVNKETNDPAICEESIHADKDTNESNASSNERQGIPPPAPIPFPIDSTDATNQEKLRTVYWTPISSFASSNSSFWKDIGDRQTLITDQININELKNYFKLKNKALKPKIDESKKTKDTPWKMNLGVFIKTHKFHEKSMIDYLTKQDIAEMEMRELLQLKKYLPDALDHKQSEKPDIIDKFLIDFGKIPYILQICDTLILLVDINPRLEEIHQSITKNTIACDSIKINESFKTLISYCLAIGNILNSEKASLRATGFSLTNSLIKFKETKSSLEPNVSVHAFIVRTIRPVCTNFKSDLQDLYETTAEMDGFLSCNAEISVLEKDLLKFKKQADKILKSTDKKQLVYEFFSKCRSKMEEYEVSIKKIKQEFEKLEKSYTSLLSLLGEPPNRDSKELFAAINSFIQESLRLFDEN